MYSKYNSVQFSSVQSLSHVRLFATPWTAARQASLSITNSWSSPKLMRIKLVMPSSHLILCHPPLLLPQSLPASESFPMSQLFYRGSKQRRKEKQKEEGEGEGWGGRQRKRSRAKAGLHTHSQQEGWLIYKSMPPGPTLHRFQKMWPGSCLSCSFQCSCLCQQSLPSCQPRQRGQPGRALAEGRVFSQV